MALTGVLRPGYIQIRVIDIQAALTHYIDRLGLHEVSREADGRVYLRAWDEFDRHSVILRPADMPGMDHSKMQGMSMPELPKNANQVPLFPQDAFMEGPMMAMDNEVDKPETYGLPAGWSGFVGGMMTLVRVLPPEQYQKIMDLKAKQRAQQSQEKPASETHRHNN